MSPLFTPTRFGAIDLASRVVMAPLTRNRAVEGNVPSPLAPAYYAQRADPQTGAALIVSEATQVCWEGRGYLHAPGIHSTEQVAGWRRVTDAVHARGGRIVAQLWHVGRVSHSSLQPGGRPPVSSTDVAARRKAYTADGLVPCSPPRVLRPDEMPGIAAQFAHGARCAMDAGFDGVEVHAANGYLIDQFLRDTVNALRDGYGGSIAGRARLLLEVMHAVAAEAGADRTGMRISPANPLPCGAPDSEAQALFGHVLAALAPLGLAFVHVIEGQTGGARDAWPFDYAALRARFAGGWLVNNGYTQAMAEEAVAAGRADAVAFGKPFIANPDLARRFRLGAPLAVADTGTYYESAGDPARGYTDYPALPQAWPAAASAGSAAGASAGSAAAAPAPACARPAADA